jgi:hypothetical protein
MHATLTACATGLIVSLKRVFISSRVLESSDRRERLVFVLPFSPNNAVMYHLRVMKIQRPLCMIGILACAVCLSPEAKPAAFRWPLQSKKEDASRPAIEQLIKALLHALVSGDSAEYQKQILPEPGSDELIVTKHLTARQLEDLRRDVEAIRLRQVSPFVIDGREVGAAPDSGYPVGTRAIYSTAFRGSAIAIPVVYTGSGWKADVRYSLAMKKEVEGGLKETDPEAAAKAFLYYILAKQPQKLQRLSTSAINPEEYTAANNLPGGDLDQILSLCIEMPIVRARVGESFKMPSGEILRAGNQTDTLILVGLLGTVEVAFQVKQVGGEWKVVPQKYFEMLRRAGAI